jgi:hypothetical protein
MKKIITYILGLLIITLTGCENDNSIISKEVSSNLLLARNINNDTGIVIGEGNSFIIMNDGKVETLLDLSQYFKDNDKELMFHLVWIDPKGKSIYKKQEILSKKSSKINSSISISPDLRMAGIYSLNVYLFRKLIIRKKFTLKPTIKPEKESMLLSSRVNRKTTKYSNNISLPLMKDKWVKATVNLSHKPNIDNQELLYQVNWIDSSNHIFYKKQFVLSANDTINAIDCSLEVAPEKRNIGTYKVQALLFGEPIAEKEFNLTEPLDAKKIKANVSLFRKSKRRGQRTDFNTGKKNKVFALFDINNAQVFGSEELNFKVVWIGINDKPFYTKRFNIVPKSNNETIKSSISISPKKRVPGTYKVQLFLFNSLIKETSFKLQKAKTIFRKKMNTDIILYSKYSKTSKKRIGVGTVFKIENKAKVRAFLNIKEPEIYGKSKELKFRFDWVGTNNKVFYSKKINILPSEASKGIKSAISINPNKRKAGKYKLRIYLFDKLINQKKFTLTKS